MKRFKMFSAVVLFLFVGCLSLQAQTDVTDPLTGTTITLPAGWKYEADGDMLVASPSDGQAIITVVPIDQKATTRRTDRIIAAAEEGLSHVIRNLRMDKTISEEVINGMAYDFLNGDGTMEGTNVEVEIAVMRDAAGLVYFTAIVPAANADKYFKEIDSIYASVR